jgi:hypothetical protein
VSQDYRASASVPTDAAARYAKQLASHLGRRAEVRDEDGGTRVVFAFGSCLMSAGPTSLELVATAGSAGDLDQLKDVVGRHLERFAQRKELTVSWQ